MKLVLLPLVALLATGCAVRKSEVTMTDFPPAITAAVMAKASDGQEDACDHGVEKTSRKANVRTKNGRARVSAKSTVVCD